MAAPKPEPELGFVTPVKRRPENERYENEEEEEEEEYSPAKHVPLSAITPGLNAESTRGTAVNWGERVGNPVPGLITPKPLDKKLFGAPGQLRIPPAPPAIQPKGPHPHPYYGRRRGLTVRLPRRGGSRHGKKAHKKTHKKTHKKRRSTRRVRFDRI